MREVRITDVTLKQAVYSKALTLTFKEKLEAVKLLDKIGVSAIEIEGIESPKADSLRIKSIASLAKNSVLAVPVTMDAENVELVWNAVKGAKHPRLQVEAAVSPSRMEYIQHKKAEGMVEDVVATIKKCAEYTDDIEFIADDATRTDGEYLCGLIEKAIEAGAKTITVCDDAGTLLPEEFVQFIDDLYKGVPSLKDVVLGVSCGNDLYMADACAVAAIMAGASEIKTTAYPINVASLEKVAKIVSSKMDACNVKTTVRTTELKRAVSQIARICDSANKSDSLFSGVGKGADDSIVLTANDSKEAVLEVIEKLGYVLSEEDATAVYEAFMRIASKKESVGSVELDAIVASASLQVPPTYFLEKYVINSGNVIKATANVTIRKNDEVLECVSIGDGPIDAAFRAIEQIVGTHYELDDFQIQSVTEGQEAMGESVVKLASEGKMYSGRGISTDIIGSSIRAYINALNKIVYEEQN